jgi:predicted methyltransferase
MKLSCVVSILLTGLLGSAAAFAEDPLAKSLADPHRSAADRARDARSKPLEVLGFFGVKPGARVLDLFSGGGYYSEILAGAVGRSGRVVAHNNDIYVEYAADEIAARFADGRLSGVEQLRSNPPDQKLQAEAFDLVLMVMTYHDIYYVSESDPVHPRIDRDRFFEQVHRSLKPGGVLAVVDHAAAPGTGKSAAQDLHRIDEAFAKSDIESAGFSLEAHSNVLRNPADDRTRLVFDEEIRGKTDRFVYRFVKRSSTSTTAP